METENGLQTIIGFNGSLRDSVLGLDTQDNVLFACGDTLILENLTSKAQTFLRGHRNKICSFAVSRCGKMAASSDFAQTGFLSEIILWDLQTHQVIQSYKMHKGSVHCLAFSAAGTYLASAGGVDDKNRILIWDLASHKAIYAHSFGNFRICEFKFFNNSEDKMVALCDTQVQILTLNAKDKRIDTLACNIGNLKRQFSAVAIDRDDRFVYTGTKTGDIIELAVDKGIMNKVGPSGKLFENGVRRLSMLAFGDRETSLVVGTGSNQVLTVDRETMKRTHEVAVEGAVTALSVLEGSKIIVCGTDKGNIYNLQVGSAKKETEAPEKKTSTLKSTAKTATLTKTGSSVANGEGASIQGLTATLKESVHVSKINAVCFPKGFSEVFATCCNEQIKVWALKRRQELLRIVVPGVDCNHVCFSDDGKMILSGWSDGKIRAFFPQSGKLMWTIEDAHANGVTALTVTADNETVISGGHEGEIRIWRVTKDKRTLVESMKEHRARVTAMHLNATGELVSCSADGSCIIWDVKNRARILCIFEKTIFKRCCFCPDGSQLLTVGSDARIAYWSAFDGDLIRHLMASDRDGEVNALDISPKGNFVVTGGQDPLLRVWSYHEGRCVQKMEAHFGPITDARISPDSGYVVSAGAEGELAIFRLSSELQSIK